jgi:hypothetical protein
MKIRKNTSVDLFQKLFGKNLIQKPEDPMTLIARLLVDQIEEKLMVLAGVDNAA